jgi:hypothetical protein
MKKELFDELLQSVDEAVAIERGALAPSRKFKINSGRDVVSVRKNCIFPNQNSRLSLISARILFRTGSKAGGNRRVRQRCFCGWQRFIRRRCWNRTRNKTLGRLDFNYDSRVGALGGDPFAHIGVHEMISTSSSVSCSCSSRSGSIGLPRRETHFNAGIL